MKCSTALICVVCLGLFSYFLIPIAKEYFTYETITTTHFPGSYTNFPSLSLFLCMNVREYQWKQLRSSKRKITVNLVTASEMISRIKMNGQPLNSTFVKERRKQKWKYGRDAWFRIHFETASNVDLNFLWEYQGLTDLTRDMIGSIRFPYVSYWRGKGGLYNTEEGELFMDYRDRKLYIARIIQKLGAPYDTGCTNYNISLGNQTITSQDQCLQICESSKQNFSCTTCERSDCLFSSDLALRMKSPHRQTTALIANSMNMLLEYTVKLDLSMFITLIFGLIGIFSDFSAMTILNLIEDLYFNALKKIVDLGQLSTETAKKILNSTDFVLRMIFVLIGTYQLFHTTQQYFEYPISSATYFGKPYSYYLFNASVCFRGVSEYPNLTSDARHVFRNFELAKIYPLNASANRFSIMSSLTNNTLCFHISRVDDSYHDKQNFVGEIALKVEINHGIFPFIDFRSEKAIVGPDPEITISTYHPRSYFMQLPSTFYSSKKLFLFHSRIQYLEAPYETRCVHRKINISVKHTSLNSYIPENYTNSHSLSCIEETYFVYAMSGKYGIQSVKKRLKYPYHSQIIAYTPSNGVNIVTSKQMSVVDWISYVSTIIGFWLGICIFDSLRDWFLTFVKGVKWKKFTKALILFVLSSCLLYHMYTRFEEYFAYESVSSISFQTTPEGIILPPLIVIIVHESLSFSNFYHSSRIPPRNLSATFPKKTEIFLNLTTTDFNGQEVAFPLPDLLTKNFIYTNHILMTLNIGESIGKFSSRRHKIIQIHLPDPDEPDSVTEDLIFVLCFFLSDSPMNLVGEKFNSYFDLSAVDFIMSLNSYKYKVSFSATQLLQSPYATQCKYYPDPETDPYSPFNCLMRALNSSSKLPNKLILPEMETRFRMGSGIDLEIIELMLSRCRDEVNTRIDCETIKDTGWKGEKKRYSPKITIEPSTTIRTIFFPKTGPIEFMILLVDVIGFWLGFSFYFLTHLFVNTIASCVAKRTTKNKIHDAEIAEPNLERDSIEELQVPENLSDQVSHIGDSGNMTECPLNNPESVVEDTTSFSSEASSPSHPKFKTVATYIIKVKRIPIQSEEQTTESA